MKKNYIPNSGDVNKRNGDVWCSFLSWPLFVVFSLPHPARCFFTTLGAQKCATLILGEVFLERQPTWEGRGWLWVGKRLESSRTITACHHGSASEWVCHLCVACTLVTVPIQGEWFPLLYPLLSSIFAGPNCAWCKGTYNPVRTRRKQWCWSRAFHSWWLHFCLNDHKSGVHLCSSSIISILNLPPMLFPVIIQNPTENSHFLSRWTRTMLTSGLRFVKKGHRRSRQSSPYLPVSRRQDSRTAFGVCVIRANNDGAYHLLPDLACHL